MILCSQLLLSSEEKMNARILKIDSRNLNDLIVALGYLDSCPHKIQNCCPGNCFMRYEAIAKQDHCQESVFFVPEYSRGGNPIVEIAIKTQGFFWEYYIPFRLLPKDEESVVEICQENKLVLKNCMFHKYFILPGRLE